MVNGRDPRAAAGGGARRPCARTILAGCLVLLLGSCTFLASLPSFFLVPIPFPEITNVKTREVRIQVSQVANLDNPVALDVLVVYDEKLMEALLGMTAKQWFAKRRQFRLDYPRGYQAWEWELVPGQTVEAQPISEDVIRAEGAVVFADYVTEGDHRARIDEFTNVLILLGERNFTVEAFKTE